MDNYFWLYDTCLMAKDKFKPYMIILKWSTKKRLLVNIGKNISV